MGFDIILAVDHWPMEQLWATTIFRVFVMPSWYFFVLDGSVFAGRDYRKHWEMGWRRWRDSVPSCIFSLEICVRGGVDVLEYTSGSAEGFYAVRKLGMSMSKDRDYGVSLDSARN